MRSIDPIEFSPESLKCAASSRSHLLLSSRHIGWTSLLLDYQSLELTGAEYETHPTPDQAIAVMTRGSLELESFNQSLWRKAYYTAGTAGLTHGGKIDRLRRRSFPPSKPIELVKVFIPQHTLQGAFEEYRRAGLRTDLPPLTALAFQDRAIVETVQATLEAVRSGCSNLYAESVAQWLSVHLLHRHGSPHQSGSLSRNPGDLNDRRLARVLELIAVHHAEPLSLERLAHEAGISKFHFVRLFRQRTGLTPHAFLTRTRLEAGRDLLLNTELGIAQVAFACGYERPSHFAAAFTAHFAQTPTACRQRKSGL